MDIDSAFDWEVNSQYWNNNYLHPYVKVVALRSDFEACDSLFRHSDGIGYTNCFASVSSHLNTDPFDGCLFDETDNYEIQFSNWALPSHGQVKIIKVVDGSGKSTFRQTVANSIFGA